ncbi:MAG: endonuclease/exonuclease/phosphatase family protein [Candidatus Omnitrophica bacterium]|nr:endonuclease/exonuclease/phosphatase family protein [Candidatus Omnitrophota bacterium]
MRIVTFNTWGTYGPPARRPVLVEAIRTLNPDLLCLQEVADEKLLDSFSYPTRLHTPESGLAVLARFPAAAHRVVTYQTQSPFETYPRQALMVHLDLGTKPLWAVTTHLAWMAQDEAARGAQVQELLGLVTALGEDVLLSGDFNAAPEAPSIRKIQEAGFLDLFATAHPDEPGITWDNRNPFIQSHSEKFPDRRIDYLFLRKKGAERFGFSRCEVACRTPGAGGLHPSDHYGVLCDLR